MLPLARPLLSLISGCCIAAATFGGLRAVRAHYQDPLPVDVREDVADLSGPRLFYPANAFPTLTLPGGRVETIRSVLNIRTPLRFGDSVWNDTNVPQGPVWIRVDLDRQLLSVFRAGQEIGTAVVLYGAADKESPAGAFPILQKAKDYHSRTYDADMPYMLRLTADGVAIHGSDVRRGAATHGCIGVPTDFARRLFAQAKLGDLVVIVKTTA